jgi:hypothetical protein
MLASAPSPRLTNRCRQPRSIRRACQQVNRLLPARELLLGQHDEIALAALTGDEQWLAIVAHPVEVAGHMLAQLSKGNVSHSTLANSVQQSVLNRSIRPITFRPGRKIIIPPATPPWAAPETLPPPRIIGPQDVLGGLRRLADLLTGLVCCRLCRLSELDQPVGPCCSASARSLATSVSSWAAASLPVRSSIWPRSSSALRLALPALLRPIGSLTLRLDLLAEGRSRRSLARALQTGCRQRMTVVDFLVCSEITWPNYAQPDLAATLRQLEF